MAKTTIVLVPGAWLTPSFYEPFLNAISETRHPVHCAEYPSLDPADPTTADCKSDADVIAQTLHHLIEDEGRDILLVLHSYAGMPGAAAARGLSKSERVRQGKSGGVVGMVFIAAFIVPEGVSCSGLQGGNLPSWILLDKPLPNLNVPSDPTANFAADVNSELLGNLDAHVKPHSTLAFNSPQPAPAWADEAYDGRRAFIVTTADQAVPREAQYGMISATEKSWIIKEMDCSHCAPFLSRIGECVESVLGLLGEIEAR
ncbi:Alpha/beta hydrolase fold-1 [Aspergillus carlsbadensis]|nr:Alpha/beta hydrolase fold-1 [Aspergillus carlsbadensis]